MVIPPGAVRADAAQRSTFKGTRVDRPPSVHPHTTAHDAARAGTCASRRIARRRPVAPRRYQRGASPGAVGRKRTTLLECQCRQRRPRRRRRFWAEALPRFRSARRAAPRHAAAVPPPRALRTTLSTPPRPRGRARDAGRVSPTPRTARTRSSRDAGPRRTVAAWRRRMPRTCRTRTKKPRRRSAPGRSPRMPLGRARRRPQALPSTRIQRESPRGRRRGGGDANRRVMKDERRTDRRLAAARVVSLLRFSIKI